MLNDHGLIGPADLEKRAAETKRARRRREAGRRRAEELQERLAQEADLRPGGAACLAAVVFGLAVHAVTLAVLLGSLLLVLTDNWPARIVAVIGFGLVWVLRPRFGKRPKDGWQQRTDLPELFAILDRVGGAIGAPTPRHVKLEPWFNAGTTRLGLRQESALLLGLPLWQVLDGDERLALLGHELGHQVNGDMTRGVLVGGARNSLHQWRMLFRPDTVMTPTMRRRPGLLTQALTALVMLPFYLLTSMFERFYAWIEVHVSLRAEFLADETSARVASTDSAAALIRKLDAGITVASYVTRTRSARHSVRKPFTGEEAREFWEGLRAYVADVPEYEFVRRERVSEYHGTRVDASHPAHYLRSRLLKGRPSHEASVTVTDEEWAAVDRELVPYLVSVSRQVVA